MSNEINTRKGKRVFIRQLMDNLKKEILQKVPDMPAEWDGHELREYIYICASECRGVLKEQKQRRKAFVNTVYVKNL